MTLQIDDSLVAAPALSQEEMLAHVQSLRWLYETVMIKDHHYGVIGGVSKPTLLQPGAELLCGFFGLVPVTKIVERDYDWRNNRFYCLSETTLTKHGVLVASGQGSASTEEVKYAWRWINLVDLPKNYDMTGLLIEERNMSEFDWVIKKRQTGGKWGKPAEYWDEWEEAIRRGEVTEEKVPNADPKRQPNIRYTRGGAMVRTPNPDKADLLNTVEKMAGKRSLVGIVKTATGASMIFTQDVEDIDELTGKQNYRLLRPTSPVSPDTNKDSGVPVEYGGNGKASPEAMATAAAATKNESNERVHESNPGTRQFAVTQAGVAALTVTGEEVFGREGWPEKVKAYLVQCSKDRWSALNESEWNALVTSVTLAKSEYDKYMDSQKEVDEDPNNPAYDENFETAEDHVPSEEPATDTAFWN